MRNTIWQQSLDLVNGVWIQCVVILVYENVYMVFRIFWMNTHVSIKKTASYMSYLAYKNIYSILTATRSMSLTYIIYARISLTVYQLLWFTYMIQRKIFKKDQKYIVYLQDLIVNLLVIDRFYCFLYQRKPENQTFLTMV